MYLSPSPNCNADRLGPPHHLIHLPLEAVPQLPAAVPKAELLHAPVLQSANHALLVAADPIPALDPAPIPLALALLIPALPVLAVLPLAPQKSLSRS